MFDEFVILTETVGFNDEATVGYAQMERDDFAATAARHPEVFGREMSESGAASRYEHMIADTGLAIRALAYRLADLQEILHENAPNGRLLEYMTEQRMLAASYNTNRPIEHADGIPTEKGLAYLDDFDDIWSDANEWFCEDEFRCTPGF